MRQNETASPAPAAFPTRIPVLLAASKFPGSGGARNDKIVGLLPQFGYDPIVICPEETATPDSRWLLETLFPSSLQVYRVRSFGWSYFSERFLDRGPDARHYHLLKILSWPERCVYVPDYMVRWIPAGIRLARRLVVDQQIPVVLTSSPHESTHLIGLVLKQRLGIRWIADFRDLWTTKKLLYRPATPLHDYWIRRLERHILERADHVIANTRENKAFYVANLGVAPERVSVIPNGFDRADLEDIVAPPPSSHFQIGYMGNFDKHGFPWKLVLESLKRLADQLHSDNVRLVHCGFCSLEVEDYVRRENMEHMLIRHGMLPHRDAMRVMAATDIRLLLLYENEYSDSIVPAKLYNYLIMNGPVLAVAPEQGAVARILAETRMGVAISPNSSAARLAELMRRYYDDWKRGELIVRPNHEQIDEYDRHRHVEQLARILWPSQSCHLAPQVDVA